MTRSIWSGTRAALVVGIALIGGACAASPELSDTPGPAPTAPAASKPVPTTTAPTAPTTTVIGTPPVSYAAASTQASIGGCQLFPPDHYLNARNVDRLPVHPRSAEWTAFLARGGQRLDAPSPSVWENARGGMPINVVDSRTRPKRSVILNSNWTSHNYTGDYPIPASPRLEGYPSAQWDRHLLMVDVADCTAYELIQYDPWLHKLGIHTALSGVRYSLDSTERPRITTNAAGTPMIGQYAMADEVAAGRIAHALGFCTTQVSTEHVWPARSSDGRLASADAPPMGSWLRLRADVDLKAFTGQARAFVDALRQHGMILTDTCGHQFNLLAENSADWDKGAMAQLERLTAKNFEVVDPTPMRHATTSFRVN